MSIAYRPSFSLPGDDRILVQALSRPGGLTGGLTGGVSGGQDGGLPAHVVRAVTGLSLNALLGVAEDAAPADRVRLYELWLREHGAGVSAFGGWFNLGVARMRAADPAGAALAYREAQRLRPDVAETAVHLGTALEAAGRPEEALAVWRTALPPAPQRMALHSQIGRLLEDRGQLGAAVDEMRAALLIDPDQPDLHQHLLHNRQRIAAWPPGVVDVPGLTRETMELHCGPLAALALFDDPARQTQVARDWIARKVPPADARLAPEQGYRHDRIRIGYFSSDFCRHAMSFLIAEVLERHDRTAFEVFGYCTSPEDGSDIRARVIAALDHHVPVKSLSDREIADQIRADEIDILIDLNGLTKGGRPGVLRWKPAPVQLTYLGYIGPVPLPELDYFLCDAVTVPAEYEEHYAPRPLRLTGCYQANDSRQPALPEVSRAQEGLPANAFVFCCASHHYKITQTMFEAWCQIVAQVDGAVLWLVQDNPESMAALQARWQAAGLAPERLIFAPRVDPDRYRARLALADLFLDTSPYNAGTIASDVLRMGLPLLTVRGKAFAARMAASLLTAVGLPDGIAEDMADYVARAVALAQDPVRLGLMRQHLAGDAWLRTLGDSEGFTRNLEARLRDIRRQPSAATPDQSAAA